MQDGETERTPCINAGVGQVTGYWADRIVSQEARAVPAHVCRRRLRGAGCGGAGAGGGARAAGERGGDDGRGLQLGGAGGQAPRGALCGAGRPAQALAPLPPRPLHRLQRFQGAPTTPLCVCADHRFADTDVQVTCSASPVSQKVLLLPGSKVWSLQQSLPLQALLLGPSGLTVEDCLRALRAQACGSLV